MLISEKHIRVTVFLFLFNLLFLIVPQYHCQSITEDLIKKYEDSLLNLPKDQQLELLIELSWENRMINPLRGLSFADSALIISGKIDNRRKYATIKNIKGVIFTYIGEYDSALTNHFESLQIRENFDDTAAVAASLNNIGLVFERINDLDKALFYYSESLHKKELLGNKPSIVVSLNNTAIILRKKLEIEKALSYQLRALEICKTIDSPNDLALTYSNLGIIYKIKGMYKTALDYSEKSLKIREEIGDRQGLAIQYLTIGNIRELIGDFSGAVNNYNEAVKIASVNKFKPILTDSYSSLYSAYKNSGDHANSLFYLEKYAAAKDSLINEEKSLKILELETKYELGKKELQLRSLELERQTTFRNYLLIITIITLISVIIITNRYLAIKKITKSLAESEEFNRALVNNLPEIVLIIVEDKIVYINHISELYTGLTINQITGKSIFEFIELSYHELVKRNQRQILEGKIITDFEIKVMPRENLQIDFLVRASFINYKGSDAILGVLNDISNFKKFQQEIIEAKNRAEKSDKLKTEFLAQISHEIRTPVNVLLNWTSLIEDYTKDNILGEIKIGFDVIKTQGKRIVRTIDMILNMSELQLGTYEPIMMKIDLVEKVLQNLYQEFLYEAKRKNLSFQLDSEIRNAVIICDEYSVVQIFRNLIENAVKYTYEGSIKIKVYDYDQNKIAVSVIDTGLGISEDYLPNLFSAFSQEDQGYSRKFEGNGLGLSLVKKYLELNNADITVQSKKDEGSNFTVTFNKVNG